MDYAALLQFCESERQREVFQALIDHGSYRKACKALGVNQRSLARIVERIRRKAALRGWAPEHDLTHTIPEALVIKGASSYYNQDGKLTGQWVKTERNQEAVLAMMREAAEAMAEELPRLPAAKAPKQTRAELLNLYTLTDCHVGMLAWHKEGGADWDLAIAERTLTESFRHMVDASPEAETGVIAQLGDWLHQDGLEPVTPTSRHILDSDGRFSKVVAVSIRILRRIIDLALAKHKRVVLLLAEGNHDMASAVWLRHMFLALYENEPRLHVIDSELPYYVWQHGKTMLAWHHGHLKKNSDLPLMFAYQFPEMWGQTTKRYCHTGHKHHVEEKEHSGMTVFQHSTLAARDAYAARLGLGSERQATCITYHSEYGHVSRNIVSPEMFQ